MKKGLENENAKKGLEMSNFWSMSSLKWGIKPKESESENEVFIFIFIPPCENEKCPSAT